MPVIEISLPEGAFSAEQKEKVIADLTAVLLKWEGATGNPRATAGALTYLYEVKAGTFAVGGKLQHSEDPIRYKIVVTVPYGTFSRERKQGLVEELARTVLEVEGLPWNDLNRFRVLCLIQEVAEGNWGSGGKIVGLLDIARFIGLDQDGPRYKELEAALLSHA